MSFIVASERSERATTISTEIPKRNQKEMYSLIINPIVIEDFSIDSTLKTRIIITQLIINLFIYYYYSLKESYCYCWLLASLKVGRKW
jgi:hypothetical protein